MYGRGRGDKRDSLPSTGQEEALPNATHAVQFYTEEED
jgi:hypothetical protein